MAFKNIVVSCLVLAVASLTITGYNLLKSRELPEVDDNVWWGPDDHRNEDDKIYEFRINISRKEIDTIYLHLNISRNHTAAIPNTYHQYGLNPSVLQNVTNFLKTSYPIEDRVKYLNQHPQYITKIQGLNIHFVRIKPKVVPDGTKLTPLLLLHGWPSSPIEFYKLAPIIFEEAAKEGVFLDLVAPSLPGYGYSDAPNKPGGMEAGNLGTILNNLMRRLGFEEYYVHGSDWGAMVVTDLATLHPGRVKGLHSNFCVSLRRNTLVKMVLADLMPALVVPRSHASKLYPLTDLVAFVAYESGYMHIQGTKPDTIGKCLDSSLESLLAFTIEKLSVAANKNNVNLDSAGIEAYDLTTLLDDLIFYYWLPRTSVTAARIYKENLKPSYLFGDINNTPIDPKVPCGCVFFEHEFIYMPEIFLTDKYSNLVHYKTFPIGGHFVALEKEASELLAVDLAEFVVKIEKSS